MLKNYKLQNLLDQLYLLTVFKKWRGRDVIRFLLTVFSLLFTPRQFRTRRGRHTVDDAVSVSPHWIGRPDVDLDADVLVAFVLFWEE